MNKFFHQKYDTYFVLFALGLLSAACISHLIDLAQYPIQPDMATLTLWALRMLEGYKMSEGFYDTNPPLSVILYIPVALLYKAGLSPQMALVCYTTSYIAAFSILFAKVLKRCPWLDTHDQLILLTVFIYANIMGSLFSFGQREQFLIMTLAPLCFYLIARTHNIQFPKTLSFLTLFLGALGTLLKPHFAIIIACLAVHRIMVRKNIRAAFEKDFIFLLTIAIGYYLVIYFFFHDFLSVMLSDIVKFYASAPFSSSNMKITSTGYMGLSLVFFILTLKAFKTPNPILYYLTAGLALSAICVLLQGKGFPYHYLPVIICIYSFLCIFIYEFIKIQFKNEAHRNSYAALTLICFMLITNAAPDLTYKRLHEDDFDKTVFAQEIKDCPYEIDRCSFYFFHETIDIQNELALYTGYQSASRFPSLWFMPAILTASLITPNAPEIKKYTDFIVQDFERFQPYTLIIADYNMLYQLYENRISNASEHRKVNFIDFMLKHSPKFKDIFQGYQYEKTLIVDRTEFFGGELSSGNILSYDIYRRIDTSETNRETDK